MFPTVRLSMACLHTWFGLVLEASSGLDADAAASLAVGLKLLSETVLQNRANPLFDGLRAPLRDFILALKSRPESEGAPAGLPPTP